MSGLRKERTEHWGAASAATTGPRAYPSKPSDVYLFGTCVIDLLDPNAGEAAWRLLEHEGIRVHFPQGQTCCGQPAYTSGFPDEARRVAQSQLGLFSEPWPIVVPSGSCAGMMHHHWPKLFAETPHADQAAEVASRVYELTEFLLKVCQVQWPAGQLSPKANRVVLHTSCSARREMGTHLHARELLGRLPNVKLETQVRESECCGFGGAFSVKHPDISGAIAGDKVDALLATGADQLVSADAGCLCNLNGTLKKRGESLRGEHLASFLWRQTGGDRS